MPAYILKRLLLMLPTLFGIVIVTFAILQLLPGGPVEQMIARQQMASQSGEMAASVMGSMVSDSRATVSEEQIAHLNHLYGFDRPVYVQLGDWLVRLFTFDFGESYYHHKDVTALIAEKLPVSLSLGLASLVMTYLLSVPLGIARAVRDGTRFDWIASTVVLVGYSIPGFVFGVFLIVMFGGGSFWDLFPIRGLTSADFASLGPWGKIVDYAHHLTLPLACLTIGSFAVMSTLTKNSFLDNIREQYVVTARAKGLPERVVFWKHVFRNSMIPLVTGFGATFLTVFFTQNLLVETLFSLDGLGLLAFNAVIQRDYPVVMANLFIFSILFLIGNLVSDLIYGMVDPRISYEGRTE